MNVRPLHDRLIIRRIEDACHIKVLGEGFPAEMVDDQPEAEGFEVRARAQSQ